jgi:DNA-binding transcriptional ArsR family regulator
MYRLHLTADDLARIRVAPTLGPFSETALAAETARQPTMGAGFSTWQRGLRGRLSPRTRVLAHVFPPGTPGLDLSTLVGATTSMEEGLDRLVGAPLRAVRGELEWIGATRPLSGWAKSLADREPSARQELAAALADFHEVAVGPHWAKIQSYLHAERAARMRCMADGGLDRLLTTLCPPHVSWLPPVLEIRTPYTADADIRLKDRALVLVPSIFIGRHPFLAFDLLREGAAVRLFYPAMPDLMTVRQLLHHRSAGQDSLAALLGRTRSQVLETIAGGCSAGDIARRLAVSAATVSQHTAVLRANGLIVTRRHGVATWHGLTPLGVALLRSRDEGPRTGNVPPVPPGANPN